MNIGFWKTKRGYITHKNGLNAEQLASLQSLQLGDKLVLFEQEVREGEYHPPLVLKRSIFKGGDNQEKPEGV